MKNPWTNLVVCRVILRSFFLQKRMKVLRKELLIILSPGRHLLHLVRFVFKCKATVYCLDCQGLVCAECVEQHQQMTIFANHSLRRVNQWKGGATLTALRQLQSNIPKLFSQVHVVMSTWELPSCRLNLVTKELRAVKKNPCLK